MGQGRRFIDGMRNSGFTIVEVLVVGGIIAVLATLSSINILRTQTHSSLVSQVSIFVSDVKAQQTRSMSGDLGDGMVNDDWGIHLENDGYILFRGASYQNGASGNFTVDIGDSLSLSWTFPTEDIVFLRRSGEVASFVEGANAVTFTNNASGEIRTVTINRYGVVSE